MPEYMLANKPIVATDVDAIPFVVKNGENGLLAPVDDDKKIAENVIKIYENDDLRESLIEEGRKAVNEKFNVKRVVKEHQRLFEKI